MTPYAYSVSEYDDTEVFPTLDAVAASYRSLPCAEVRLRTIYVHFPDGSRSTTDLSAYMEEREVDVAAVEAYIDQLCEETRKRDEEADAQRCAEGRSPVMVTGWAPIYCLDRQQLINREIETRRYVWKPLS